MAKEPTLAVLAGGAGSRMGRPKALLRVGDQPILEYLLRRWNRAGPTMLVTAPGREHPPGWERFDSEVVDDVVGGGPLQGVLTALRAAMTEAVVIATCDMPLVGIEQLQWVASQLGEHLGVMCCRGQQIEPFPSVFRLSAVEIIAQRLSEERRSVQSLADVADFKTAQVPANWAESVWLNLNRPADLAEFEQRRD